jgi:predicted transcriptional regulator of viral defense system
MSKAGARGRTRAGTLAEFVARLQADGRYTFDRAEALAALDVSPNALKLAAHRLAGRGALVAPRRGFFVIVPAEYRKVGAPPPSWYVDALMRFQGKPYYVGLVSAAAIHGAAHHAVQEFHVVTDTPLRPIEVGRSKIRFFVRRDVEDVPVVKTKTETGEMRVSSPEATAMDLARYPHAAGTENVPTLLAALAPKLHVGMLVAVARHNEPRYVQRLGALLDRVGARGKTAGLARLVARLDPPEVALRPDRPAHGARLDRRWRVRINDVVEVDA